MPMLSITLATPRGTFRSTMLDPTPARVLEIILELTTAMKNAEVGKASVIQLDDCTCVETRTRYITSVFPATLLCKSVLSFN